MSNETVVEQAVVIPAEVVKKDPKPKKKTKKPVKVKSKPVGRPSLWVNPEVLNKLVDEYFENEKQPTLSGLAVSLNISRSTLYNYAEKDEFLDIIKRARAKIMKIYEGLLIYGGQPTGVIFALKNMGWADNQAVDLTTKGKSMPIPILGGLSRHVPKNDSNPEDKPVK